MNTKFGIRSLIIVRELINSERNYQNTIKIILCEKHDGKNKGNTKRKGMEVQGQY